MKTCIPFTNFRRPQQRMSNSGRSSCESSTSPSDALHRPRLGGVELGVHWRILLIAMIIIIIIESAEATTFPDGMEVDIATMNRPIHFHG
jgi:hypothetical protein